MVPGHVRAGLVGRNQPATGGRLLAHALQVLLRWLVHLPDQPWSAHDDATEFHRAASARRRCDPWSEAAAALLALDTHAPEAHAGLGVVRAVDAEQLYVCSSSLLWQKSLTEFVRNKSSLSKHRYCCITELSFIFKDSRRVQNLVY